MLKLLCSRMIFNQDEKQLRLKVRLYKDDAGVTRVKDFAESVAMLKE